MSTLAKYTLWRLQLFVYPATVTLEDWIRKGWSFQKGRTEPQPSNRFMINVTQRFSSSYNNICITNSQQTKVYILQELWFFLIHIWGLLNYLLFASCITVAEGSIGSCQKIYGTGSSWIKIPGSNPCWLLTFCSLTAPSTHCWRRSSSLNRNFCSIASAPLTVVSSRP